MNCDYRKREGGRTDSRLVIRASYCSSRHFSIPLTEYKIRPSPKLSQTPSFDFKFHKSLPLYPVHQASLFFRKLSQTTSPTTCLKSTPKNSPLPTTTIWRTLSTPFPPTLGMFSYQHYLLETFSNATCRIMHEHTKRQLQLASKNADRRSSLSSPTSLTSDSSMDSEAGESPA